jgi:hypothetical protein
MLPGDRGLWLRLLDLFPDRERYSLPEPFLFPASGFLREGFLFPGACLLPEWFLHFLRILSDRRPCRYRLPGWL